MRHAEELSTTMAPAFAAIGEYSLLTEPGVLLRTICTPANASGRISSTVCCFPANSTVLPALFSEARNLIDLTGKLRSTSTFRIRSPTAPVAPTTATFTDTATPLKLEIRAKHSPTESIRISLTRGVRTGVIPLGTQGFRPVCRVPSQVRCPMRIAVGGFMHESNTFAPLPADLNRF